MADWRENLRNGDRDGRKKSSRSKGRDGKDRKESGEVEIPEGYTPAQFEPTRFGGVTGAPDLMLANSPWLVSHGQPGTNELRIRETADPNVVRFQLLMRDLSGGPGTPTIEVGPGFVPNTLASSSLDTRFPRTLSLPMLLESDTDSDKLMGNEENLAVAVVPSETREIVVGGGDVNGQSLFRLGVNANGDMLVKALAYNPGSGTPIISLGTVHIADSSTDRLLVGRKDAVAQILTNFSGVETFTREFPEGGSLVVPAGVTSMTIEGWGGGGAGAGIEATGPDSERARGGGGGGAYSRAENVTVTPGDTLVITDPSGGTGDDDGGANGGDAQVTDNNGSGDVLMLAKGGSGGTVSGSGGNGGQGGQASSGVGDVKYSGGNGASGSTSNNRGGGGGGGAGDSGNGSNASNNTGGNGGDDGGGKGGNAPANTNSDGSNGAVLGGGGGGAYRRSNSDDAFDGGNGARGLVRITYTVAASDTPTTLGSMHADTENTWGAVLSPLNAETPGATTILMHAGNKLLSLSSTAAVDDQPVTVLDGLPEGSYMLGIVRIPGMPLRLYMALPNSDDDTSTLARDDGFRIWHIDLEGASSGEFMDMGLPAIAHALIWRDGIVATDTQSVVWHNGDKQNLGALKQRVKSPSNTLSILCLAVDQDRLFAFVQERAGTNVVRVWWEEYQLEQDEWHALTPPIETGGNQNILPFSGLTPIYKDFNRSLGALAHRMFWYEQGVSEGWRSMSLLPTAINPFYWQETSSSSPAPRKFAATGSVTLPRYHMIGFEGLPKVVDHIWFGGEMPATANGDSSTEIAVASQLATSMSFDSGITAEFREQDRWDTHLAKFPQNMDAFDLMQIRATLNQGTGTNANRTTPNGLPFMVSGLIFLDGVVRMPVEVEPRMFE